MMARGLWSFTVIQQNAGFDFESASNARNVVDRDIAFGPLDPAEIGAVDAALVGQRFGAIHGLATAQRSQPGDVRGLPRMLTARAVAGARREERRRRSWGISV